MENDEEKKLAGDSANETNGSEKTAAEGSVQNQGEETAAPEVKRKQSREDDSRFAELRRENERLKKELAKSQQKAQNGITDNALADLGFSRDDLRDEDNMSIAELYMKAKADGEANPIGYAYQQHYKAQREAKINAEAEARKKNDEENEISRLIEKDKSDFLAKYSREELAEAMDENSEFRQLFGDQVHVGNVEKMYSIYRKMVKGEDTKAKSKGILPNASGNSVAKPEDKPVDQMTNDEYREWCRAHGYRV